jgi:uncharacterized protein YcbK (DUF882 family)
MTFDRRTFLRSVGISGAFLALPAFARTETQSRTLKFVHTHTGEALTATYAADGCYDAGCLTKVNHLLRDFRTGEVHPIDPKLLDILHSLQSLADRDAPFHIISGFRSPETNSALRDKSNGVAKKSLHMEGMAIDIRLDGFTTAKLRDLAQSLKLGGVGFYKQSDFIHVDTGRIRYW